MKKLFILNEAITSSGNGIGTYIQHLITCLSSMDITITIIVFNSSSDIFSIENVKGIQYFNFPSFPNNFIHKYSHTIINIFRLYIPDSLDNIFLINHSPNSSLMKEIKKYYPFSQQIYIIHDMTWTIHLFGDVEKYIWILKQRKKNSIQKRYSSLLKSYQEEIEMCTYANQIICLSQDTFQLLWKYYSVEKRKLFLIPNILFKPILRLSEIRKKVFREKKFLKENEKIILYVGRISELKGIFIYIEAFKQIVKVYNDCRLVIVGPIPDWKVILEKCYPILTKISFTGQLPSKELEKWYEVADIGILPSYTEQCSYVGLEMKAHGLPIIASDGFGVRCMFNNENAEIARIGKRNQPNKFKDQLITCTLNVLNLKVKKCLLKNSNTIKYNSFSKNRIKTLYKMCFKIK